MLKQSWLISWIGKTDHLASEGQLGQDSGPDNGTPDMLRHPLLRQSLIKHFSEKIAPPLKHAVFVPLGDKVVKALNFLASEGWLSRDQILDGLPHPSPANVERIRFFIGQKSELSVKTNAEKLVSARNSLMLRVQSLEKNRTTEPRK